MADNASRHHTIKSHGLKVARFHMRDWITFLILIAINVVLNVIEPFHRFIGEEDMSGLKYPLKDNTVPTWAVPLYAGLLPLAIFVGIYCKRKDVYDLHHATLGLFYSALITGVITDTIKITVGRPRPDFYERCFPEGSERFDSIGDVLCYGDKSDIKEGRKSFPSGHSSWSFAGLGFLSWYLAGKIKAFNREGHISKLCIVFAPLLGASLVAISRVDDYRHHWQDVFIGGLLGLVVASFCYLQFFPPPYDENGWCTYDFVTHVARGRSFPSPLAATDSLNTRGNALTSVPADDNVPRHTAAV